MSGRPGRSGGHNKLSVEQHRLRGTLNVTRHTPRGALVPQAMPSSVPVPATLLDGLRERGRTFVSECWTGYGGWSPAHLVLLREAGLLIDELEQLRGEKASGARSGCSWECSRSSNLRDR